MAAVDPKALINDHTEYFKADELRQIKNQKDAEKIQKGVGLSMKSAQTRKARLKALKSARDKKRLEKLAEQRKKLEEVRAKRTRRING